MGITGSKSIQGSLRDVDKLLAFAQRHGISSADAACMANHYMKLASEECLEKQRTERDKLAIQKAKEDRKNCRMQMEAENRRLKYEMLKEQEITKREVEKAKIFGSQCHHQPQGAVCTCSKTSKAMKPSKAADDGMIPPNIEMFDRIPADHPAKPLKEGDLEELEMGCPLIVAPPSETADSSTSLPKTPRPSLVNPVKQQVAPRVHESNLSPSFSMKTGESSVFVNEWCSKTEEVIRQEKIVSSEIKPSKEADRKDSLKVPDAPLKEPVATMDAVRISSAEEPSG